MIDSMQKFYGLAIRQNPGNLYAMKKAIGAILSHCTDYSERIPNSVFADNNEYRHRFCPRDVHTWCKFQKDKTTKKKTDKDKINLP